MILLLPWETADYTGIFNGKKSHSITAIITKKVADAYRNHTYVSKYPWI